MKVVRDERDLIKYAWRCTYCFKTFKLTKETIVSGMNIKAVDSCLELWLRGSSGKMAEYIGYSNYGGKGFFKVFRKCCAHYFDTRIRPYLILPGPVDIDETQVGAKRFWMFTNRWPECRWIFGLCCWYSKIPVLYHIPDKKHTNLV